MNEKCRLCTEEWKVCKRAHAVPNFLPEVFVQLTHSTHTQVNMIGRSALLCFAFDCLSSLQNIYMMLTHICAHMIATRPAYKRREPGKGKVAYSVHLS